MKTFLRYLFAFCAMLMFISFSNLKADSNVRQVGLLWQISKPGVKPSYLFGTIHSEDTRVTKLPPIIRQRFEQSDSVTLEMLMDTSSVLQSLGGMYLEAGQTLNQFIDDLEYNHLVNVLAGYGMPEEAVKHLKPWATMLLISMPKPKTGRFLDLILYERAQQLRKPLYGLETTEEQLAIFEDLSIEVQVTLLKETLQYLDEMQDILDKMHTLYLQRDLTAMQSFSTWYTSRNQASQTIMDDFNKRIINERNIKMLERMQPRLAEGNAFIAVGALHLPGNTGLLRLLQKRGYRVKAIY